MCGTELQIRVLFSVPGLAEPALNLESLIFSHSEDSSCEKISDALAVSHDLISAGMC